VDAGLGVRVHVYSRCRLQRSCRPLLWVLSMHPGMQLVSGKGGPVQAHCTGSPLRLYIPPLCTAQDMGACCEGEGEGWGAAWSFWHQPAGLRGYAAGALQGV
jgi:hypothetical protein